MILNLLLEFYRRFIYYSYITHHLSSFKSDFNKKYFPYASLEFKVNLWATYIDIPFKFDESTALHYSYYIYGKTCNIKIFIPNFLFSSIKAWTGV